MRGIVRVASSERWTCRQARMECTDMLTQAICFLALMYYNNALLVLPEEFISTVLVPNPCLRAFLRKYAIYMYFGPENSSQAYWLLLVILFLQIQILILTNSIMCWRMWMDGLDVTCWNKGCIFWQAWHTLQEFFRTLFSTLLLVCEMRTATLTTNSMRASQPTGMQCMRSQPHKSLLVWYAREQLCPQSAWWTASGDECTWVWSMWSCVQVYFQPGRLHPAAHAQEASEGVQGWSQDARLHSGMQIYSRMLTSSVVQVCKGNCCEDPFCYTGVRCSRSCRFCNVLYVCKKLLWWSILS